MTPINDIEESELNAWTFTEYYFWQVLSGDISLEEARDNICSFRNTKHYTGNNPKYKKILD